MRKDMYKVIHDTVRQGSSKTSKLVRSRAKQDLAKASANDGVFDDALVYVGRQSMRRPYKEQYLNKSTELRLAPLRRFLASRVGQPWAEVYSELRTTLTRTDRLLDDPLRFLSVEVNTAMHEGDIVVHGAWGGIRSLDRSYCRFYVHPVSGVLCAIDRYAIRKSRKLHDQKRREADKAERRVLNETTELRKIDGIWYELTLAEMPSLQEFNALEEAFRKGELGCYEYWARRAEFAPFDMVLKRHVTPAHSYTLKCEYMKDKAMYARAKRQLSHKELIEFGLETAQAA